MKNIARLLFLLFTGISFLASAMSLDTIPKPNYNKAEFRRLFTQANLMMGENFNDSSLATFLILHKWDPSNANVNFKIGQLYLKSSAEKQKAIDYLEAAAKNATRKYQPDEPNERKCPELVYYFLGQAYHLVYRFDEAIAMFEKFMGCINLKDVTTVLDIKRRIEICQSAKMLVNAPVACTITNLGDSINTAQPEYGPIISADESIMYFTSRRFNAQTGGNDNRDLYDKYYEDIWYSNHKSDGTWTEAKPLSSHINSWYNEAVTGLSADGQQLFVYKDENGGSIYYSQLEGDQWSYAIMLGSAPGDITDINTPAWEPTATLSPDGNTLYFVSNRPGGLGGRDIYESVKLPNGRWSKGRNLGSTINTKYDEDAPFIHPDGVTMFFSSNGHTTMGGFDIFFSTKQDSGWTAPQNIGYPINTTDDDIFYVMSANGKRAYFSSVRPEGKGEKDIYMVTLPQNVVVPVTLIKGHVSFSGKRSAMPPHTTILATDIETGTVVQEVHPNSKTMKYILPLNPGKTGKKYSLSYEAEGYRLHSEIMTINPESEYKEVEKDFDFKLLGTITVYGSIKTRAGAALPGAKITVKDNVTKKLAGVFTPQSDCTYSFDLDGKGGENYSLSFEADGYLGLTEALDLPKQLVDFDFQKDIIMETANMLGTLSMSGTIKGNNHLPIPESYVVVSDNKTGKKTGEYKADSNGKYYFNLPRGNNYNVSYQAEGYLFQSENINVPKDKTYTEIRNEITLEKIEKGAKIVLNNIFFDSGKSTLRKESNNELDILARLMITQPNLKVEIGGYTDNKGLDKTNLKLSQDRANAVTNALLRRGINKTRLSAKGYGKTQPIAANNLPNGKPDSKGMQKNRRVEFKILEN